MKGLATDGSSDKKYFQHEDKKDIGSWIYPVWCHHSKLTVVSVYRISPQQQRSASAKFWCSLRELFHVNTLSSYWQRLLLHVIHIFIANGCLFICLLFQFITNVRFLNPIWKCHNDQIGIIAKESYRRISMKISPTHTRRIDLLTELRLCMCMCTQTICTHTSFTIIHRIHKHVNYQHRRFCMNNRCLWYNCATQLAWYGIFCLISFWFSKQKVY